MAAATPSGSRLIEDSLSCSICCEKYDTSNHVPKFLPCHHTFCASCIDNLLPSALSCMECPVCRKMVTSRDEVCINLAVRDIVEAISVKQEHELFCCDHPSRRCALICTECYQPICAVCVRGKHNDHKIDDIENAKVLMEQHLDNAKVLMQQHLTEKLKERIASLEKTSSRDQLIKSTEPYVAAVNFIQTMILDSLKSWTQDRHLDKDRAVDRELERCHTMKAQLEGTLSVMNFHDLASIVRKLGNDELSEPKNCLADLCLQEKHISELQRKLTCACETICALIKDGSLSFSSSLTAMIQKDRPHTTSSGRSDQQQTCTQAPSRTVTTDSAATLQIPTTAPTLGTSSQTSSTSGGTQISRKQNEKIKQMDLNKSPLGDPNYVPVPEQPSAVQSQGVGSHSQNCAQYSTNVWGQQKITRSDGSIIVNEISRDLSSALLFDNFGFVQCGSADLCMDEGGLIWRYGGLEELRQFNARPGELAYLKRKKYFICHLIIKETSNSMATIQILKSTLWCLREHCLQHGINYLAMAPLGCEKNEFQWEEVRQLLVDVFLDTEVKITVYMENE